MVVIFSIDEDQSTNEVLEWLDHFGVKFNRINPQDLFSYVEINLNNNGIKILLNSNNQVVIDLDEISSFWYRRGLFRFANNIKPTINEAITKAYYQFIENEQQHLNYFIFKCLSDRNIGFNNFHDISINKLSFLNECIKLNILVPNTHILTTKKKVHEKFEGQTFINKSIGDVFQFSVDDGIVVNYTSVVDKEYLADSFFISLFQGELKKKYEVRSFFWNNQDYSMAIFSQSQKESLVDFRVGGPKNRVAPFKLPKLIKDKVIQLLKVLKLKSASLDFIVTPENKFYLLDCNPIGQFGMVSGPCNYYLERLIAKTLKQKTKR